MLAQWTVLWHFSSTETTQLWPTTLKVLTHRGSPLEEHKRTISIASHLNSYKLNLMKELLLLDDSTILKGITSVSPQKKYLQQLSFSPQWGIHCLESTRQEPNPTNLTEDQQEVGESSNTNKGIPKRNTKPGRKLEVWKAEEKRRHSWAATVEPTTQCQSTTSEAENGIWQRPKTEGGSKKEGKREKRFAGKRRRPVIRALTAPVDPEPSGSHVDLR